MDAQKIFTLVVVIGLLAISITSLSDTASEFAAVAPAAFEVELTPQAYLPVVRGGVKVWQLFSPDSPWNVPIGPDPAIDPNSDAMIATLETSGGGGFWINLDDWTIPVYYADAHTPIYDVPCDNAWEVCGAGFGEDIPIPDDAMPDPADDAHMVVVDLYRDLSWDMFRARPRDGGWVVEWGYLFDLEGDGVQPEGIGSARASGFPLLAGLIRWEEIQRGYIDHALVIAYDAPRPGVYVYPASTAYDAYGDEHGIPMGGRLQLDPTIDVETLELSEAAKIIARALQEYGAYVGDFAANSLVLYGEGLYGKPDQSWAGVLAEDDLIGEISWESFRVLELPPIKTAAYFEE
ncbi:MAG: hypothetical protein ACLFTI_00280 [Anaerolineales bacterium]